MKYAVDTDTWQQNLHIKGTGTTVDLSRSEIQFVRAHVSRVRKARHDATPSAPNAKDARPNPSNANIQRLRAEE